MKEEWIDIIGYDGKYQISNLSNIKSMNYKLSGKERVLKQFINSGGYYTLSLCKNGISTNYFVHRLMFENFIGEIPKSMDVNHIDGNKLNNSVENLEILTRSQNLLHSVDIGKRKIKPINQLTLSGEFIKRWNSGKDAFNETKIFHIRSVANGMRHHAGGYKWEYTT